MAAGSDVADVEELYDLIENNIENKMVTAYYDRD